MKYWHKTLANKKIITTFAAKLKKTRVINRKLLIF